MSRQGLWFRTIRLARALAGAISVDASYDLRRAARLWAMADDLLEFANDVDDAQMDAIKAEQSWWALRVHA